MSSPLSFFRKHQRILLAVFGVVIMITFTVGGIITGYQSQFMGGSGQEDVAVAWKHGKVSEQELFLMRKSHNLAVRFLDLLIQRATLAGGTPKGPGLSRDRSGRIIDPGIPRSAAEEDTLRTMLLAAKAEQMGVSISEEAIFEFLAQLSDDVVPRSDYESILNEAARGYGKAQLFEQLRIELLAQNMRLMAMGGMYAVSPEVAWDYFNRLNRRVKAEVLPLKVDEFKSKVTAEPSNAEVDALYAEGKERFPDPASPEPGFKRRRKIAFNYLKGDFGEFQNRELANITPQQVQEYYEKNKNDFKVPELPPAQEPKTEPPVEPKTEAKTEPQPAEGTAPTPSPEAAPPANPPAEPPPPEPKPADTPAPPATPELQPPANETPPPAEGKQSRNEARQGENVMRFVSLLADEQPAAPAPEQPPATPAPAETAPAPAEPAPAAAPAPAPAEATPPTAEPAPAEPAPATPPAQPEAPAAKPVQYKPLAEVEAEIRRNLARAPAQDKLNRALSDAKAEIDSFFKQHAKWEAVSKVRAETPKPTPPDPETLAKKHGLVAGETPLVDDLKIEEYELGKAYQFSFAGGQMGRIPFAQLAYVESVPLYRTEQIRSFEVDVEFLYWRVEEEKPFVPELKDIRAEVVDAWKHREALKVAKAEAERLAQQAKGEKPLKESLGEPSAQQVVETNEFSWLTHGAMPVGFGAPMLSSVDGVDSPGAEFMEAVFALAVGETGVAVNNAQSYVYVVRLASETPDEDTRRKQFLETGITFDTFHIAIQEQQSFLAGWYRDLEAEMKVTWKRPPQEIADLADL